MHCNRQQFKAGDFGLAIETTKASSIELLLKAEALYFSPSFWWKSPKSYIFLPKILHSMYDALNYDRINKKVQKSWGFFSPKNGDVIYFVSSLVCPYRRHRFDINVRSAASSRLVLCCNQWPAGLLPVSWQQIAKSPFLHCNVLIAILVLGTFWFPLTRHLIWSFGGLFRIEGGRWIQ